MANINGTVTLKKWQLFMSILVAIIVIAGQFYLLAADRWGIRNEVENITKEHNKLNNSVSEHIKLPAHNFAGFNIEEIKSDIREIKVALKELNNKAK